MAKADINFCGFETGDIIQAQGQLTFGTLSIQTSVKRTGAYALRTNPTANYGYFGLQAIAANGKVALIGRTAETFYTFYIRVASLPAATSSIVNVYNSAGSVRVAELTLTSGGVLTGVGATNSATIATLSVDTWYRIDLRVTSNSTCGAKVDGGTEQTFTGRNGTQDTIGLGASFEGTLTFDIYWDDLVIGTTALDAGVGPCVRMAKPIGAGNYAQWVNGTGSTFAEVDEVPHDSNTTVLTNTAGTSEASTFDMQAAATVGIVGTIYSLLSCIIVNETSSTSTLGSVRLRSGSTNSDSTSVDFGTTAYIALQKIYTTDPADAAAWTPTKFDGCEVGPLKGTDASSIRCTAVYLHVCEDGVSSSASATITGVTATMDMAAGIGVVQIARAVPGESALMNLAANPGTVATVRIAAVAGEPATLDLAANPGTVATSRIVTVAGQPAVLDLAANPGVVGTQRVTSIAGQSATLDLASNPGVVIAMRVVTVAGEPALLSLVASPGVVVAARIAAILGEAAVLSLAANAGAVQIARAVPGETANLDLVANPGVVTALLGGTNVVGVTAELTLAALAGVVSTARYADIAGATALLDLAALAGVVSGVRIVTIAGEPAALLLAANPGVVGAQRIVAVTGETATLVLAAMEGVVSTARMADIAGATALLSLAAFEGTVATVRIVTIAGETAQLSLAAMPALITAVTSAFITGQPAALVLAANAGVVVVLVVPLIGRASITLSAPGAELSLSAAEAIVLLSAPQAVLTYVALGEAVVFTSATALATLELSRD